MREGEIFTCGEGEWGEEENVSSRAGMRAKVGQRGGGGRIEKGKGREESPR
jgi:hypothetical protein